ncbi:Protein-S-isoprenylcysteine O-methyltransferase Ste14 [Desulfosporosinus hippei DSM 8344]|uniref:Protein-S-isoprenylcysteine O-methyltransferase Ste14 n=2 Tax=Desulfosporosinus TaxID=79206 RepID=A0A1G8IMI6_9FIRM|nr:Protein-S-isoprenylcysteine O-methyltransferase Ste14 [Desulfosporosinus hippei DSM 8344]
MAGILVIGDMFMLNLKNSLSLFLFLVFLFSYLSKLLLLKKRYRIDANVLSKGRKESPIRVVEAFVKFTTFLWGVVWLMLSLFEPLISQWSVPFVSNSYLSGLGLLINTVGLGIFIVAMIAMKTSWRVGIDKSVKTSLVTDGIYQFSRNPAFVGFDLMFMGLFLTYPSLLTLVLAFTNILAIHLLILQEEVHLKATFQEDYLKYFRNTGRYFIL